MCSSATRIRTRLRDAPNDPWNLDTFFKTIVVDAGGNSVVTGISALGPLDEQFSSDPANYTASADAYVIEDFVFNPTDGVTSVEAVPIPPESTVPEPSTVWLMLLGSLLLLRSAGMASRGCAGTPRVIDHGPASGGAASHGRLSSQARASAVASS